MEGDLLSVNALPSAYRTVGDGAAHDSGSIQHEFLENALKDVTQRSSALLHEIPVSSTGEKEDSSLLTIVQSQRERFRLRVQELESENSQQTQNIQGLFRPFLFRYYLIMSSDLGHRVKITKKSLSQEIENLRVDNVKLYEKIKFLQNYRPNSGYKTNNDDEAGKKYASQYEG